MSHSLGFCLDNRLLLESSGSGCESCGKCCNFSHSGSGTAGLGNALLLCLNNSLLLFFNNCLLLSRSGSCQNFSIERFHFSLECELFSGLTNRSSYLGLSHNLGFGLDNCLLLRCGGSGCESGSECCNLSHSSFDSTGLGNAFLLCVNNSFLLLFSNCLLLCGSLGTCHSGNKCIHLTFELSLLSSHTGIGLCCLRFNHSSCFGLNDRLLLRSSSSGCECSVECIDFCGSRRNITGFCQTAFLCIDNGLNLFLCNSLLLCGGRSSKHNSVERFHLCFKAKLFGCLTRIRLGSRHCFCFDLNNRLLLLSGSCFESG